jgi:type IV secretory pathway VirB10-like protein
MVERRQRLAPDFAPSLRDDSRWRDDAPDDVDEGEGRRTSLLSVLVGASALRRALAIVPLAVVGYAIAWFAYSNPSQNVTAKPAVEVRRGTIQAAPPIEPPPPAQPEAAGARSVPAPEPAATPPVEPAPPPAVAAPPQPLSKDEIKELQGKLGEAGFPVGPIDGIAGPQTQEALRRYARARSLARPPEVTQETLLRLRSESRGSQ